MNGILERILNKKTNVGNANIDVRKVLGIFGDWSWSWS